MIRKKVRVLFEIPGGRYQDVFQWETKKQGSVRDVVFYLMEKFTSPSDFPAGYTERPLTVGDRLEITILEGPLAGEIVLFELISQNQVREV